jgi:integrase/recombinase XerD
MSSMSCRSRVRVSGPLVPHVQGFAAELERLGYTAGSAEHQLRLLAHLSRWLEDQVRDDGPVGLEEIAAFVDARREAGRRPYRSLAGVSTLVEYLSAMGLVTKTATDAVSPVEDLLGRYRSYLLDERGLVDSTVRTYIGAIRPFLEGHAAGAGGVLELTTLSAAEVTGFLLEVCRDRQPSTGQNTATALRSLLRFLHLEGVVGPSLADAVPSVASWKLSPLPRALEPGEVSRLLGACDRRTALGRRDLAMLLLLVRLGLRAGEVAALELDDLDWHAGELVVAGKGGRRERLPLPDDVGQAVVGYLRRGRPATVQGRPLFVRFKAPHRRLSAEGVSARVAAAARRAGLGNVRAHRLRHTAATSMLAAGAPLAEIGQLLRHRKTLTTAIYAKTDVAALRTIARPWPAGVA